MAGGGHLAKLGRVQGEGRAIGFQRGRRVVPPGPGDLLSCHLSQALAQLAAGPWSSSARLAGSFYQLGVRMQRELRPPTSRGRCLVAAAPAEGAHHARLSFLAIIPSPALL